MPLFLRCKFGRLRLVVDRIIIIDTRVDIKAGVQNGGMYDYLAATLCRDPKPVCASSSRSSIWLDGIREASLRRVTPSELQMLS